MDGRDELPALPRHTGIVWETEHIVWAGQQRCDPIGFAYVDDVRHTKFKLAVEPSTRFRSTAVNCWQKPRDMAKEADGLSLELDSHNEMTARIRFDFARL